MALEMEMLTQMESFLVIHDIMAVVVSSKFCLLIICG